MRATYRFLFEGGRKSVVRVRLARPTADGMHSVPLGVLMQPDGDLMLSLRRCDVRDGVFDAATTKRFTERMEALQRRTLGHRPGWLVDAGLILAELGMAAGALTQVADIGDPWSYARAAGIAVVAPLVTSAVRPWLLRFVIGIAGRAMRRWGAPRLTPVRPSV